MSVILKICDLFLSEWELVFFFRYGLNCLFWVVILLFVLGLMFMICGRFSSWSVVLSLIVLIDIEWNSEVVCGLGVVFFFVLCLCFELVFMILLVVLFMVVLLGMGLFFCMYGLKWLFLMMMILLFLGFLLSIWLLVMGVLMSFCVFFVVSLLGVRFFGMLMMCGLVFGFLGLVILRYGLYLLKCSVVVFVMCVEFSVWVLILLRLLMI